MDIHPDFLLNGIPFHGNTDAFCQAVENTFPQDAASRIYAREITDFFRLCIDDTPAILCHTSGSTGAPKAINLEKIRMEASAQMTCRRFVLPERTRALLCLPMPYIAGRMMIVRALVAGWHLEATVPSSRFLEGTDGTFDFAAVVPLQLYESIGQLARVHKILVGGGSVSRKFLQDLASAYLPHTTIYQSYAMTETITHVAVRELYPTYETAYTALEGVEFSLSPAGTLVVTAPEVAPDPVVTNDIARLTDPRHFTWQGRADTAINSGGIKIFPEDTEAILSEVLTGRYFAAGIPDERLGNRQVLFVEGTEEDFSQLEQFLETRFDPHHRPKQTVFIARFPLTHTGKTDRRAVIDLYTQDIYGDK